MTIEEAKNLLIEMRDNCLKDGKYNDPKRKNKAEAIEIVLNALIIKTSTEGIEAHKNIIKFCEDVIELIKKTKPQNEKELLTTALGIKLGYEVLVVIKED